ncbi:MAG: uracil-DNA glycosylase [Gammaproteobacteria bacterium]|nr:uracil-DNA glycosylase [Gammaproteobacteria bacterium]
MSWPKPWFNLHCKLCPRLAQGLADVRREFPHYHAAPVPPFGDRNARLLIVGLAPGMHGANRTGRPFTGDHAGIILYETLHRHGFANQATGDDPDDGLKLIHCRISNAVKCLPPANKPTGSEVRTCNAYLAAELSALPKDAVIIALGRVAHEAVLAGVGERRADFAFGHGYEHALARGGYLLDSYHCSRYNTQTRRLTPAMFDRVFARAAQLIARAGAVA